jgi:ribosomal protein S18 acetylase RimI-like enzyme
MPLDVRFLRKEDAAVLDHVAAAVFDDPLVRQATKDFLADDRHHIVVAIDADVVVGFVTAVHYLHPDKSRPELWINEVGVAPSHHRRGVGKSMMKAVLQLGAEIGCSVAWVMTERDNVAAMELYRSAGALADPTDHVMFSFDMGEPD